MKIPNVIEGVVQKYKKMDGLDKFKFVRGITNYSLSMCGVDFSSKTYKLRFMTFVSGFVIFDVFFCIAYTASYYRHDFFKILMTLSGIGVTLPVRFNRSRQEISDVTRFPFTGEHPLPVRFP